MLAIDTQPLSAGEDACSRRSIGMTIGGEFSALVSEEGTPIAAGSSRFLPIPLQMKGTIHLLDSSRVYDNCGDYYWAQTRTNGPQVTIGIGLPNLYV